MVNNLPVNALQTALVTQSLAGLDRFLLEAIEHFPVVGFYSLCMLVYILWARFCVGFKKRNKKISANRTTQVSADQFPD